jgi:hypothetical protein
VPFLEISRDDFGPDRDRVIVAADYLGAIMLWPRDEERRQRWCAAAAAFTMANKLSGALPKVAVHGETALFLARAPRPEEFEEEAAKLRDHGTFVGSVICELVGRSDRGRARTEITHATAHVAKVFSATGKKVSVSTINHAMPRFRPVAHLLPLCRRSDREFFDPRRVVSGALPKIPLAAQERIASPAERRALAGPARSARCAGARRNRVVVCKSTCK